MQHYLYILIDVCTIIIPLAFSFYSKSNFSKKWKHLLPAIAIPGIIFIVWDMLFTKMGIWGFNPKYVIGLYIYNLPIEEVLFFITVPYASVFTYEAINFIIKEDKLASVATYVNITLIMFLLMLGVMNNSRWYTGTTFISCAIFIFLHQWKWKTPYLGKFYLSFLVILFPFFIVNGILTGSFIDEPVVWYNENEMLGIRLFTIPFEDIFYGLLLILMNITVFERSQQKISMASHG